MLTLRHILTKDRHAAGALIFDPRDRLLLVRDRLRGEWNYPGGYVDRGESALTACAREVAEEVAVVADPARFRLLGAHRLSRPKGVLLFTTFVLHVSADEAAAVRLQARELSDWQWASRAQALELVAPRLRQRLADLLLKVIDI